MGATTMPFSMDFQMDGILWGLQALLPHCPLSLWSLQGTVTANEFGQYCLEVLLALTEDEGDQMVGELEGADRVESPEVFWDSSMELGSECQGHSTQCSQRDKCLFCGQTSPTSHCQ